MTFFPGLVYIPSLALVIVRLDDLCMHRVFFIQLTHSIGVRESIYTREAEECTANMTQASLNNDVGLNICMLL